MLLSKRILGSKYHRYYQQSRRRNGDLATTCEVFEDRTLLSVVGTLSLNEAANVSAAVYDTNGQLIRTLYEGESFHRGKRRFRLGWSR